MKILLIGKNGQLGGELFQTLSPLGEIVAVGRSELDITNFQSIRKWAQEVKPQVIVNAAAYTEVDKAESEPELAMAINGTAPGILAEEARSLGAALIHYSTDYVFDGTKGTAYVEADTPNPINVYGKSKLAGDQNVRQIDCAFLILRTAWVYSMRQGSFVRKVLDWARKDSKLRIVSDQVGSPTWARALADVTAQVLAMGCDDLPNWLADRKGLYHLGGLGCVSRLDWARKILEFDQHPEEQIIQDISAVLTSEFPTPATRPLYSPIDCTLFADTFGICLPDWKDALRMAMAR